MKPLAAALLAATALAGCKAVGPNFQPPAPPSTTGYLTQGDKPLAMAQLSPDVRVAGAWWKSFGSADLDRVMDQALTSNARHRVTLKKRYGLLLTQQSMVLLVSLDHGKC